jgi:predicted RNase H-like HicB family nuclease
MAKANRKGMRFTVEIEREDDGRWIAEVMDLPGVMAYGPTRKEALASAEALALRVLADRLEHGETAAEHFTVAFEAPA